LAPTDETGCDGAAAAVGHIEKWLLEADALYGEYDSENGAASNTNSAMESVLLRRRKLKCPIQLHPRSKLVVEAYALLADLQARLNTPGMIDTDKFLPKYFFCVCLYLYFNFNRLTFIFVCCHCLVFAVVPWILLMLLMLVSLSKAAYALRRVIAGKQGLLAPSPHPEVGAEQCKLAQLLLRLPPGARSRTGGTGTDSTSNKVRVYWCYLFTGATFVCLRVGGLSAQVCRYLNRHCHNATIQCF
jgi:hypothetical protein